MYLVAPVSSIIRVDNLFLLSTFLYCNIFAIILNVVDVFVLFIVLFSTCLYLHTLVWNNSVQKFGAVIVLAKIILFHVYVEEEEVIVMEDV